MSNARAPKRKEEYTSPSDGGSVVGAGSASSPPFFWGVVCRHAWGEVVACWREAKKKGLLSLVVDVDDLTPLPLLLLGLLGG